MVIRSCGLILGMRYSGSAAARRICFTTAEANFLVKFTPCAGRILEKSNCVVCKPPQSQGGDREQNTPEVFHSGKETRRRSLTKFLGCPGCSTTPPFPRSEWNILKVNSRQTDNVAGGNRASGQSAEGSRSGGERTLRYRAERRVPGLARRHLCTPRNNVRFDLFPLSFEAALRRCLRELSGFVLGNASSVCRRRYV